MKNYFKNIYSSRYILNYFVKLDLKNKYRNSILGFSWNLLTPLGLVVIIGVVYSVLFSTPLEEFIPYLFSGLIPWLFIVGSADGGCMCFLGAQGYIKQVAVPLEIYPLRMVLVNFINLLLSLCAFFIVCIFLKPSVYSAQLIFLLPALITFLVFGVCWATLAGFAQVYVRDYAPLQSLIMQGLFYTTPIIYPAESILSTPSAWIVKSNPLYYFMKIIRNPLLGEPLENYRPYLYCWIIILVMFNFTLYLYKKVGRRIAFKI